MATSTPIPPVATRRPRRRQLQTTLPVSRAAATLDAWENAAPTPLPAQFADHTQARRVARRKWWWIALLTIGFWFARPYYWPWTAEEENDADTRAIAAQGSIERQLAMPALGLLAVYILWRTPRAPKFKGRLATLTAAFCALQAASIAWSVDPATTLRRLVVFYLGLLLAIALARTFDILDIARLGFYSCGAVALLAAFCDVFVTRTFAPFDPEYRFLGVMSSNSEAQNLTACIFCGLTLLLKNPRFTRWMVPALLFGAAFLYFTRSRTATFACVFLSLFFIKRILDARLRIHTRIVVGMLAAGLMLSGVLLLGGDKLGDLGQSAFMMGRDDAQNTASLSNRAPLWDELMDYVWVRPWQGYGYNAFWTSGRISVISAHQHWGVPNAHNTYLDQELSGGVLSVALYTAVLWGGLFVAWKRYRRNPCAETLLAPVMISWLTFTTFAESIPLDPFLPTFLVYVLLAQTFLPEGATLPAPIPSPAKLPAFIPRPLRRSDVPA
jgi:O-antigen ligase